MQSAWIGLFGGVMTPVEQIIWCVLVQKCIDNTNGRVRKGCGGWSGNCVYLPVGGRGAAALPHTSEADEPTLLRVIGISTE